MGVMTLRELGSILVANRTGFRLLLMGGRRCYSEPEQVRWRDRALATAWKSARPDDFNQGRESFRAVTPGRTSWIFGSAACASCSRPLGALRRSRAREGSRCASRALGDGAAGGRGGRREGVTAEAA